MFAFEFPDKKVSLHTGHFRTNAEIETHPIIVSRDINELYLDTTYLNLKPSFRSQELCIQKVLDETETYYELNEMNKVLVVFGSFVLGT